MYSLNKLEGASKCFCGMVSYAYSLTKMEGASKCFWRNGELHV